MNSVPSSRRWKRGCKTSCSRTQDSSQSYGPDLKGSKHANMKELRFAWERQVWRMAFALDPKRRAILLAGGDKGGVDQKRFHKGLIAIADRQFDEHITSLKPLAKKR